MYDEKKKILEFLGEQPTWVSQSQIGRETGIEDQCQNHKDWQIKRLLEDLEQEGLVKKSNVPRRKNGSEWKITTEGRKHLKDI